MFRARGLTLVLLLHACKAPGNVPVLHEDPLVVPLWWIPGADALTWDEARAGMWWGLSNLGAAPPADEGALTGIEQTDEGVTFTLDLGAAGFPPARLPAVAAALAPVRAAAAIEGPVDLGRFLLATLYDPGRYYAITGACPTVEAWRAARQAPEPGLYAVTVSLLVEGHRLVELNPAPAPPASDPFASDPLSELGWLASEGEGSLADGTFEALEFETVDVMPNGQQRFAVYDADGALRAAGAESRAGQPGKCMWCHELHVQRGTSTNPSAEGYLPYEAFEAEVEAAEALLATARAGTPSAVDWAYDTHEWAEKLTLALLEPSPERVAREWGVSVDTVHAEGLPTHPHGEFSEWGPLYDRADVDRARADREPGWAPLPTPPSDRDLDPDWPLDGADGLDCAPAAGAR